MENKNILRAMDYVNQLLIPMETHYYHQYSHALDVMKRAMYLAKKEGLWDDEIEILAIASLFHDTGFVIQYDKNEPIWAKIARNYLKSMLYDEDKIKLIEQIILSTDPKYKTPKNILEEIIKDADLDNLGRDDFMEKGDKLKLEIEEIKKIKISNPDWNHGSINFLAEHKYFTVTQKNERLSKKKENKQLLQHMLDELEKDI